MPFSSGANRSTRFPVAHLVQRHDRRLCDIPSEQRKDVRRRIGRASSTGSLEKCLAGLNGSSRNAGVLEFTRQRWEDNVIADADGVHAGADFWRTGGVGNDAETRSLLCKHDAGQMVEVSQHLGDTVETVELRKKFFERYTSRNELITLISAQFGRVGNR